MKSLFRKFRNYIRRSHLHTRFHAVPIPHPNSPTFPDYIEWCEGERMSDEYINNLRTRCAIEETQAEYVPEIDIHCRESSIELILYLQDKHNISIDEILIETIK